jgi:hypothetical protein
MMQGRGKRDLGRLARKLIHLLLILTAGGLAPLSYLDGYSPHQGFQGYKLSLFQPAKPIPLLPDDAPAALKARWPVRAVVSTGSVDDHYLPDLAGVSRLSGEGWGHGYPLPVVERVLFSNVACFALLSLLLFWGRSAWLAPPEKPPNAIC